MIAVAWAEPIGLWSDWARHPWVFGSMSCIFSIASGQGDAEPRRLRMAQVGERTHKMSYTRLVKN
jgi:hypothetical protein